MSTIAALREAWEFRNLWRRLVARDITLRYRQTFLGVGWIVLQPVLGAGAFSLVFGKIARMPSSGVSYFTFALTGLIGWTAFSGVIVKATSSLIGNSALVSKVFFPRILLPISTLGAVVLDYFAGFVVLLIAIVLGASGLHPQLALSLVFTGALLTMGLGIGLATSALVVKYRDVAYVVSAVIPILLYASPIAYGLEAVPDNVHFLYELNPLTGLLGGMRWSILGTPLPSTNQMLYSFVFSFACLGLGTLIFLRAEKALADVI